MLYEPFTLCLPTCTRFSGGTDPLQRRDLHGGIKKPEAIKTPRSKTKNGEGGHFRGMPCTTRGVPTKPPPPGVGLRRRVEHAHKRPAGAPPALEEEFAVEGQRRLAEPITPTPAQLMQCLSTPTPRGPRGVLGAGGLEEERRALHEACPHVGHK
eukprot:7391297-Prymnesium_polylepis.1